MKRQYTHEEYEQDWKDGEFKLTICFCSCYIDYNKEWHHESCPNYKEKDLTEQESVSKIELDGGKV